jgi:hypothetical protein
LAKGTTLLIRHLTPAAIAILVKKQHLKLNSLWVISCLSLGKYAKIHKNYQVGLGVGLSVGFLGAGCVLGCGFWGRGVISG